jgi:predicted O-linked N-acetylglucosamine transferase (SPINDLY family)
LDKSDNAYKLNPRCFESWMRILRAVEGSVLWLSGGNSVMIGHLCNAAKRQGVKAERLVFAMREPSNADHLARHRLAGLFLDTLPYNAHT